jgi:RHS repeat-associated protein
VVHPRWVGSGWAIFNNKGKPVRQYEPFFSATHDFEFGVMVGVSPVLFYDPAERVVATLHPNHTYEKVVFDPWQQTTYDVNDNCASRNRQTGDPRTDPDIGGYVAEYFKALPANPAQPWQTWHAQRIGGALGADERNAAQRAAVHADTPATACFDTLGRPFLTVARNRVVCAGHDLDGTEDSFATRVELDIEGNQRAVRDAVEQAGDPLGRIVIRYAYDMLGNRIHQESQEAGARWMLNDVVGKPIRSWDSRGHNFTTAYDALRRPVEQTVRGTTADSDPRTLNRDILVDKIEYGEPSPNATPAEEAEAQRLNLRTRIYQHFDSAGVATNSRLDANGNPTEAYDFKGNPLHSTRRLVSDYTAIPDWLLNPQFDAETFEGSTRYDALNRPIQSIALHSSLARAKRNVIQPVFNEANLLERVDVWLERVAEPAGLLDPNNLAPSSVGVADIDYDAKGQRIRIDYKTEDATIIRTTYAYDRQTFRLTHLYTRRGVDPQTAQGVAFNEDCDNLPTIPAPEAPPMGKPCGLQNLHYTYDPVGNITHIRDDAQQTIYFRNQRVEPSNDYVYDALYRLIQATGREHLGQGNAPIAHSHDDAGRAGLLHPGDGNAMGTYIERYVYDAVGNFLQMQHRGSDPALAGWTRAYDYLEPSLIEDGSGGALLKTSNRLTRTTLNPNGANSPQVEPYQHDAHGNMVRMPHLGGGLPAPNMHWDYKDRLRQADLGGGAFYVYDASGQRVRKVWEKAPGFTEERIYLGGFEVFRKHNGPIGENTATRERETLHVMDDKQRIALVETRTLDTASNDQAPRQLIRHQFGNHLGSTSLEVDDQAQIISYEEYAPYGSSTYQAVRSRTETTKRYRYSGKERDEGSGLYYHGARYYAAWLGRWTSADPAGLVDGPDLYRYARNCPVVLGDPSGKQPPDPRQYATREEFLAASPSPYAPEYLNQIWDRAHPPTPPVRPKAPQWELGPRGERIPTAAWEGGPLRPLSEYDKPLARIQAEAGNYEAAELAQNYLCASCHVLTKVDPREFSLRGYVQGWQKAYIQGFIEVPLKANPIGAAWEIGVSGGQAITGEGSGLHISNISSALVEGRTDLGTQLSTKERLWEGGNFVVGAVSLGYGAYAASAKSGLGVASGGSSGSAPATIVRAIRPGEKIADIVAEGKSLTFATGNEHALVSLANGERVIVSGGPTGIDLSALNIRRLIGHSHPYHLAPTGPSAADFAALKALGQRSSYLLEHGTLTKF